MKPLFVLHGVVLAAILLCVPSVPLLAQDATLPAQAPAAPPPPPGPPPNHPPRSPLVEALDTNHDGVISAEELANAAVSLKALDKNGDGQLTQDELRPPPPPTRPGGAAPSDQVRTDGDRRPPGDHGMGNTDAPRHHPLPPDADGGGRDHGPYGPPDGPADAWAHHPHHPPGPAGEAAPTTAADQHAPASVHAQRPPPHLADDPVAARLGQPQTGQEGRPAHTHPQHSGIFDLLDTNHDGVLSDDEINNAPAVLKKLDRNAAGQLTPDAFRPAAPPTPVD